jgi:hypothetical protein
MTTNTGLLIIRAWREDGPGPRLRAQVSMTRDVLRGFERTVTLVDTDAVAEAVTSWLTDLLGAQPKTQPDL